jgi:Protein of unknown function (DUF1759)
LPKHKQKAEILAIVSMAESSVYCVKCQQVCIPVVTCRNNSCNKGLCKNCLEGDSIVSLCIANKWRCPDCTANDTFLIKDLEEQVNSTPGAVGGAIRRLSYSAADVEKMAPQLTVRDLTTQLKLLACAARTQVVENERLEEENEKMKEMISEGKKEKELCESLKEKCDKQEKEIEEMKKTMNELMKQFNRSRENPVEPTSNLQTDNSFGNESLAQSIASAFSSMRRAEEEERRQEIHDAESEMSQLTLTMIRASLPELPKFSGVREEFPLFEKVYNTTTESGKFTEELNHLRLVKSLEGEAKRECLSLLNSMAGGSAIMKHLKAVYGNAEKILTEQVERLMKMKDPKLLEKHQLKEFVTQLESFVINAKELKREEFLKQPTVNEKLVHKLRDRQQDAWGALKTVKPDANLEDLLKYLQERLKDASAQPPSENKYRNYHRVNSHHEEQSERKCERCKSNSHELRFCREFKSCTHEEKIKLLREKRICDCCLRVGHRWRECPQKRMCNIDGCKRFHHRLLHVKIPQHGIKNHAEKSYAHTTPNVESKREKC